MTEPSKAATQNEAHVASNTKFNVLRPAATLTGTVLWPAFQRPRTGTAATQTGRTGVVLNHFHYRPGVMSAYAAQATPTWTSNEVLEPAEYLYDKLYEGQPVIGADVDLFHGNVGVDLDDYEKFKTFFSSQAQSEPRVKELTIRFTVVDVINDQDWFGKGELVFQGKIDGQSVGKTAEMKVGSGEKRVALAWQGGRGGSATVDVLGRTAPIALELSGVDIDVVWDDALGKIAASIGPPWPLHETGGCAATKSYVVYWQIVPGLLTEEQRAEAPPKDGGDPKKPEEKKLLDAYIGSRRTDERGRFEFGGLRAGEYILSMRGRLAFVQTGAPGGDVSSPPANRHNGISTAPLAARNGKHPLCMRVKIAADGAARFFVRDDGADTEYEASGSPPQLYVLPLVVKSNAAQWASCIAELGHAFGAEPGAAESAMAASPMLDLEALERFDCAEAPYERILQHADDLLKRTLLLGSATDDRTMAFDHAYWCFATAGATTRTRGRFLPLGTKGFFTDSAASDPRPLYRRYPKTKETFGRFAVRFVDPLLSGADVRELKIRLCLWGERVRFVDLVDDVFDRAVKEALLRFKRSRQPPLYRHRVDGLDGAADDAASVITSIVDEDTFTALDASAPSFTLATVASNNHLLAERGQDRRVLYAAEIARSRLNPGQPIVPHSAFRTLRRNREIYLGANHLFWRVASNAGNVPPFNVRSFHVTIHGEMGRNAQTGQNTVPHAAGDLVTPGTIRWELPRGTYTGVPQSSYEAADFSAHTTGEAFDFDLSRTGATYHALVDRVQWDNRALVLFGAQHGGNVQGRIWVEQQQVPPYAGPVTTDGTRDWIHLDTTRAPGLPHDFALTDTDVAGPRWDANVIVLGRVTRAGQPLLGARVELRSQGNQAAPSTFSDSSGCYALRLRGAALGAGYFVQASYNPHYDFQPAPAVAVATTFSQAVPVVFPYPGREVNAPDLIIPP